MYKWEIWVKGINMLKKTYVFKINKKFNGYWQLFLIIYNYNYNLFSFRLI